MRHCEGDSGVFEVWASRCLAFEGHAAFCWDGGFGIYLVGEFFWEFGDFFVEGGDLG